MYLAANASTLYDTQVARPPPGLYFSRLPLIQPQRRQMGQMAVRKSGEPGVLVTRSARSCEEGPPKHEQHSCNGCSLLQRRVGARVGHTVGPEALTRRVVREPRALVVQDGGEGRFTCRPSKSDQGRGLCRIEQPVQRPRQQSWRAAACKRAAPAAASLDAPFTPILHFKPMLMAGPCMRCYYLVPICAHTI